MARGRAAAMYPPLRVTTREFEKKLRLIYDRRYNNLSTKYEKFK